MSGVSTAVESINEIAAAYRTEICHRRVVINMINQRFRRHKEAVALYKRMNLLVYEVPQDAKLAEAQYAGDPLLTYDKRAKSLQEISRLTHDMEAQNG